MLRRFAFFFLLLTPSLGFAQTKSAFETDGKGWLDLMPTGPELKGWKRVPIPPDKSVPDKKVWTYDAANKSILCQVEGAKEMLLYEGKEFGDGIFHGEWRFKKSTKDDYNSGLYIRTAADGTVWHQVQVAHIKDRPFVCDLFYDKPAESKPLRVIIEGTGHKHAKMPDAWNTFEVTMQGKTGSVWLNGHVVTKWDDFPRARGHVGMQAENYIIEYRNLKFK